MRGRSTKAPARELTPEQRERRARRRRRDLVWLGLAALALLTGLGLRMAGGDEASPATGGGSAPGVAPSSFVGGSAPAAGGGGATEAEEGAAAWSPLFVKGGFGFFVGFAAGFALRTFFKVTALVAGVVALALFGLSRAGLVEVDWSAMGQAFDGLAERVRAEAGSLQTLFTGALPSAAAASLGLVVGLRRG